MRRRDFIEIAAASGLASASPRKPNILFILADELGTGNVSCYGADNFKTPYIDQLALEGTRYTHCYTAPLCGPSCAMILTGRYPFRTGATSQDATARMKPTIETMMPAYLKPSGYVTAAVGKWGQLPLEPAAFGFDEHLSHADSKQYIADEMHSFLVDFIGRHQAGPFYVYYSLSNLQKPTLPAPDSKQDSRDFYADNIRYLDKLTGKLIAELERLKLRDDTLLVFCGDNGTGGVYADESTIGGRRLVGEKGSMLEGGALVPMIVNWPGRTRSNSVCHDLVDSTDFLPTLAQVAGIKLPEAKVLDGRSFVPQEPGQSQPRDWVFIELARSWYVRDGRWKLNQAGHLFDMTNSPFDEPLVPQQTTNAAAIEARKRLQAILDRLNPAGGIVDDGDATGRHAGRPVHSKKKSPDQ